MDTSFSEEAIAVKFSDVGIQLLAPFNRICPPFDVYVLRGGFFVNMNFLFIFFMLKNYMFNILCVENNNAYLIKF